MDSRALRGSTAIRGIAVFLGLAFLFSGGFKLAGAEMMVESFERWGYPPPLMYVVGAIEVAAAVMVVTSRLRLHGALLIFVLMLGAALTHINAGEWIALLAPVVMLVLSGLVIWSERTARPPREVHA